MKKTPHWAKEIILLFIVGIISLIWRTENWYDICFLYFLLHWLYSFVKINIMEEEIEVMSDRIDRLTHRNGELEEELENIRS